MTFSFAHTKTPLVVAIACASIMAIGCSNMETQSSQTDKKTETADSSTKTSASASSSQSTGNIITGDSDPDVVASLTANLITSGAEQTNVLSAQPTNIGGMYWVVAEGAPPFFTDKTGQHIFQGQVIKVGDSEPIDIGAKLNEKVIEERLAAIPKQDMIIYPAKGETRSKIFVFTDSTCPYCQKLHEDIEELNAKGIEVRYLAWPRNDRAVAVLEAVWCSDDRIKAMNDTKAGRPVSAESCDSPVKNQTDLGFAIGVRGTPAIYSPTGEQLGGYIPPAQIEKALGL